MAVGVSSCSWSICPKGTGCLSVWRSAAGEPSWAFPGEQEPVCAQPSGAPGRGPEETVCVDPAVSVLGWGLAEPSRRALRGLGAGTAAQAGTVSPGATSWGPHPQSPPQCLLPALLPSRTPSIAGEPPLPPGPFLPGPLAPRLGACVWGAASGPCLRRWKALSGPGWARGGEARRGRTEHKDLPS